MLGSRCGLTLSEDTSRAGSRVAGVEGCSCAVSRLLYFGRPSPAHGGCPSVVRFGASTRRAGAQRRPPRRLQVSYWACGDNHSSWELALLRHLRAVLPVPRVAPHEHKCDRACTGSPSPGSRRRLGCRARSAALWPALEPDVFDCLQRQLRGRHHHCRQWRRWCHQTLPGSSGMANEFSGCGPSSECCGWTAPLGLGSSRSDHCPCA